MANSVRELVIASLLTGRNGNAGQTPVGTASIIASENLPTAGLGQNPFVFGHRVGSTGRNRENAVTGALIQLALQQQTAEALGEQQTAGATLEHQRALEVLEAQNAARAALQRQQDEAAMARVQAQEAGATSRSTARDEASRRQSEADAAAARRQDLIDFQQKIRLERLKAQLKGVDEEGVEATALVRDPSSPFPIELSGPQSAIMDVLRQGAGEEAATDESDAVQRLTRAGVAVQKLADGSGDFVVQTDDGQPERITAGELIRRASTAP